jgi:hypothetical protein
LLKIVKKRRKSRLILIQLPFSLEGTVAAKFVSFALSIRSFVRPSFRRFHLRIHVSIPNWRAYIRWLG